MLYNTNRCIIFIFLIISHIVVIRMEYFNYILMYALKSLIPLKIRMDQ